MLIWSYLSVFFFFSNALIFVTILLAYFFVHQSYCTQQREFCIHRNGCCVLCAGSCYRSSNTRILVMLFVCTSNGLSREMFDTDTFSFIEVILSLDLPLGFKWGQHWLPGRIPGNSRDASVRIWGYVHVFNVAVQCPVVQYFESITMEYTEWSCRSRHTFASYF